MNRISRPVRHVCSALRVGSALLALAALNGCQKAAPEGEPINVAPAVQLVKPERRDLHREVGQPGYLYAYEQTSLYPKITGYIEKWYVDIGDNLKKGQLLADLYVPELKARYQEKKAQVKLSQERVGLAERNVEVAESNVQVAAADVVQARAEVAKYEANVERWESEVKRLGSITDVVNVQVLEESKKQLKANRAALNAAEAAVKAAQSRELARKSDLAKARVEVETAKAQVEVDQAAEENLAAQFSYTHMHAPYDGTVVVRNANTGDYVEPRYGDASPPVGGYAAETRTAGTPLYIVARTDLIRVYVDVPEMEANYVRRGTKARVRVQASDNAEFPATVTRTSWALDFRSRTLRAEIDLPNKDRILLPGMYAYGLVEIERRGVRALPMAAVVEIGNETCCYLYEDGKAVRTPVQTGINDGQYVEVFRKQIKQVWQEFTGQEEVILGELAELRDGGKVRLENEKGSRKEDQAHPANEEKR
jgi:HlyD family secretion protein